MLTIDVVSDVEFIIYLLLFSLVIGMMIFRLSAGHTWVDSFYNSSMILTAIGTNDEITGSTTRILVSLFAIYSSVVFLVLVSGVVNLILSAGIKQKRDETFERDIKPLLEDIKKRLDQI